MKNNKSTIENENRIFGICPELKNVFIPTNDDLYFIISFIVFAAAKGNISVPDMVKQLGNDEIEHLYNYAYLFAFSDISEAYRFVKPYLNFNEIKSNDEVDYDKLQKISIEYYDRIESEQCNNTTYLINRLIEIMENTRSD